MHVSTYGRPSSQVQTGSRRGTSGGAQGCLWRPRGVGRATQDCYRPDRRLEMLVGTESAKPYTSIALGGYSGW
ncbi:hypothetical protein AG1IA_08608 [Rhizoctonia solani AG-1 IA]|uniref:Uncharacterized protein n=1 Tax=Thanatephorus cucumeris (strain AG1-IA) TaxID=983506 RepID=L8WHE3_THACA|nr:hypothetical protein AG1IA_08608 [Rhizoctonia solani AG-1 IA]